MNFFNSKTAQKISLTHNKVGKTSIEMDEVHGN